MKKTLFLVLLCIAGSAQAVETIVAKVNGMVCAFCAQGIEKKARALPETQDVYVNLKEKVVAIQVKENQKLSSDVVQNLIREAGYDIADVQVTQETAADLRMRMEHGAP